MMESKEGNKGIGARANAELYGWRQLQSLRCMDCAMWHRYSQCVGDRIIAIIIYGPVWALPRSLSIGACEKQAARQRECIRDGYAKK